MQQQLLPKIIQFPLVRLKGRRNSSRFKWYWFKCNQDQTKRFWDNKLNPTTNNLNFTWSNSIDVMIIILSINIMLTTLNKMSLPTKDPWKRKWILAKKTKTAATKISDPKKWKQKLKRRKHISDILSTNHDNNTPPKQICRTSQDRHCVKSVRIWSYAGQHFPAFGLNSVPMWENADQNNSEYEHLSCSVFYPFRPIYMELSKNRFQATICKSWTKQINTK